MTTNTVTLPTTMQQELRLLRTGFKVLGTIAPKLTGRIALNMFLTPRKRPFSPKSRQIMAQAEQVSIAHGSRRLAAYVWENDGPTVLLIHGWESNASGMRGFVRPLRQQGFRVVAFDAPAHGRSSGRQTNFVDYSGAIETIIKRLGPAKAIVAHSFGSAAALFTLSRLPDVGVACMVSLGAPSRLNEMVDVWTSFLGIPLPAVEQMRGRLVDRVGLPVEWLAVETAVSQLAIPGLIIHDQDDTIVPYSDAEAIHRQWPSSILFTTTGLDHRGILQDRKVLHRVVDFLVE